MSTLEGNPGANFDINVPTNPDASADNILTPEGVLLNPGDDVEIEFTSIVDRPITVIEVTVVVQGADQVTITLLDDNVQPITPTPDVVRFCPVMTLLYVTPTFCSHTNLLLLLLCLTDRYC